MDNLNLDRAPIVVDISAWGIHLCANHISLVVHHIAFIVTAVEVIAQIGPCVAAVALVCSQEERIDVTY